MFFLQRVDSIARAPNIQQEFVYVEHLSIVSDFWIYIRAQVPLEEEEGALDDANFNFGDDCGQCSLKEGAKDDSKIDPNRQQTRNFFRDASILSTTESMEALLEEDEVIYLLASIKAAAP